jgi:hypothetical protein
MVRRSTPVWLVNMGIYIGLGVVFFAAVWSVATTCMGPTL